jgi:Zinc finger, C2H2 type
VKLDFSIPDFCGKSRRRHKRTSLTDGHECAFCANRFQQRANLVDHLETYHSDKWPVATFNDCLPCPFCRRTLPNKYTLNRHILNSHYKRHAYECHHCDTFNTLTKSTLKKHLLMRHFNIEQTCLHCDTILPNRRAYIKHTAKHHPTKTLQCPGCKRTFATTQQYKRHMRTQKVVVHCQQCETIFHTARALDAHMANFHNKVYVCEICEFPLGKLDTYNAHMLNKHGVHQKPRCGYCGREFESNEQLDVHQKTDHESLLAQDFICDLCGKGFVLKHSLAAHLKAHRDKVESKMIRCHLCGKMLKHAKNLESHIKVIHLKIRKRPQKIEYKCPKCPQWKFPGRQSLGGHMIVHNTENRPFFQCLMCGMAYTRKHKYDVHVTKCPENDKLQE